jgi:putative exporter of polyketide antibiotics
VGVREGGLQLVADEPQEAQPGGEPLVLLVAVAVVLVAGGLVALRRRDVPA